LPTYQKYAAVTLPCHVGRDVEGGVRQSDGRAGHISFGPYLTVEPGTYFAGFYLRALPGSSAGMIDMDVLAGSAGVVAQRTVSSASLFEDTTSLVALEFTIHELAPGTEVRLFVHENVLILVDELVIFSRAVRSWGGK